MKSFILFLIIIKVCFQILNSESIIAQEKKEISNIDIHYKYRDNNRWEGVKFRKMIPRATTLTLESLIGYDENKLEEITLEHQSYVSIFYYLPILKKTTLTLFNLEKKYFLDPDTNNFKKIGFDTFTWPTNILNAIELTIDKLDGIVKIRTNGTEISLPVFFTNPTEITDDVLIKFTLFSQDKDMIVDLALYQYRTNKLINLWKNVQIIRNKLTNLRWNTQKTDVKKNTYKLVATEMSGLNNDNSSNKHIFLIHIEL